MDAQRPSHEAQGTGPSGRWAAAAIVAAAVVVFAAGVRGKVVVGDECYHFMFARAWSEAGLADRPAFNPLYGSGDPPGYYYVTGPLWPMGLALVWDVTGVAQWSAQAYQAGFYALALAMVYAGARRRLGPRGGMAALLAAISVPMLAAFSVLLYTDVAATALAATAMVLLLDRRHFWAGAALGLAYLTKRHAVFLAGPMVLWVVWEKGTARERLGRVAAMLAPMALVALPNALWQRSHIPAAADPTSAGYVLGRLGLLFSPYAKPSSLLSPADLAKYFGAVVPLAVAAATVRRVWQREDRGPWVAVGLYVAATVLFFTLDTDVRYLMPAAPVVAVVAARGLEGWWRRRWVLAVLAAAAFAHLGATAVLVGGARRLTPGQEAVFAYLEESTPEGSLVLYPSEAMTAETGRPVVWAHLVDPETGKRNAGRLLATFSDAKLGAVLSANGIRYVCVEEGRIVPDGEAGRYVGFPRSLVERMGSLEFLEEVRGEWPGVRLFRFVDSAGGPGEAPSAEGADESPAEKP